MVCSEETLRKEPLICFFVSKEGLPLRRLTTLLGVVQEQVETHRAEEPLLSVVSFPSLLCFFQEDGVFQNKKNHKKKDASFFVFLFQEEQETRCSSVQEKKTMVLLVPEEPLNNVVRCYIVVI